MIKSIQLRIKPRLIHNDSYIRKRVCAIIDVKEERIRKIKILKRSIDARKRQVVYVLAIDVYIDEVEESLVQYKSPKLKKFERKVIVVGAGPAGYFAALQLLELGIYPIVLEQGKDVRARRRDLKAIQQDHFVSPISNYCFGEGGAGTYSDGKLYTRAKKRGDVSKILQILVSHGAHSDIKIDAHPHIGSNKLPNIIANIRQSIIDSGGEVHFSSKVVDFIIKSNGIKGVRLENGNEFMSDHVILATGHSAREIYYLCHSKGLRLENKAFALGVRIEHPQALIDEIQYNQRIREDNLPAASYSLACQVNNKAVFSFCMCPGGLIVPAATNANEIVLNGMSLSKRDSPFANAGMVVAVDEEDLKFQKGEIWEKSLLFQKNVEQSLFQLGTGDIKAPSQRLTDFLAGKASQNLPKSSYIPGIYSCELHKNLPKFIVEGLRIGIRKFDNKMRGFLTSEALILACESRTSSPIRIPRNDQLRHPQLEGLYPCGEGAGYAGGILSAALDGQRVGKAIAAAI